MTVIFAVLPPAIAEISASPGATPVTEPSACTVAISGRPDDQVMLAVVTIHENLTGRSFRLPTPEDYAAFTPGLTAHRCVNAIPLLCEGEPGLKTTLDLPHILPRF